ncbi:MMPL family transporter [Chryseomicrobium imtechense]
MKTLATFVTRFYKSIIAFWVILLVASVYFAIQLPSTLQGDGFRTDGEHEDVMETLTAEFDIPNETILMVFEGSSDDVIEDALRQVDDLGVADTIVSPLEDESLRDGDLSYAQIHFDEDVEDLPAIVDDLKDIANQEESVTLTGGPVINKDINTASQRDLASAEAIGLPIAIVVLLLAFGSVMASFVPLIIGVMTVVISLGVLGVIGNSLDLSIFILNIIPMLGLALSIDFALLFINRYKEERLHSSIIDSVQTAVRTSGRSIIFSAICVFIGLGAMLVMRVDIFMNIALGGTLVVTLAVLSSLTLLPALLMLIGDRINKWTILRVRPGGSNRWQQFAAFVMRRPVALIVVAFVLLGIAIVPVKDMNLSIPQVDSLPEQYESRQSYDLLDERFGFSEESTVYLLAERSDGWDSEEARQDIFDLQESLQEDEAVTDVATIFTATDIPSPEVLEQQLQVPEAAAALEPAFEGFIQDDLLFVPVTLDYEGSSSEAQQWVRDFGEREFDYSVSIGGQPKFNQEIFDEISSKIGLLLAIILGSTFIILMIAFRSILIPLKAIIMNIIGLAATFGILVYIFQFGHFGLPETEIALIIPVIVFSLVFGLSMDYEVFLISRIQEEYVKTQNNTASTITGLVSTSKIITSAALIMIVITGAFAFTDVMPVKQIGVGIAIAIAIDATIIRLLLVPSLMKLFGKWNWWLPFRKGPYKAGGLH